jgi:hypothetical protein
MGTFVETADVDYRLSLPNKENKLLFSLRTKQTEIAIFR